LYYTAQRKITLGSKLQDSAREKIKAAFKGHFIQETGEENGGLKVIMDSAFLWFRASKTEPNLLRIVADSRSKRRTNELLEQAMALFSNR
jgi:phosphomannomutase